MEPPHESRHVVPDAEGRQDLAGGRKGPLHPHQHDGIVFARVFSRDVVKPRGAHGRGLLAEATVKVQVGGDVKFTAAEGNGPVNALATALQKALVADYPVLDTVRLTDYKVRILDSKTGTGASTRVLIDFQSGSEGWTTVGASTNIIEASWRALADSMAARISMARRRL